MAKARAPILPRLASLLLIFASNWSMGQDMKTDPATRRTVVEQAATVLEKEYVFPDIGAKIAALLRRNLASGAYDNISSAREFAAAVGKDLRSINGDKHLELEYSFEPIPEHRPAQSAEADAKYAASVAYQNGGFTRVERLDGNVGLIELQGFFSPELAGEEATEAMAFVKHTDALIIDIRNNGGGNPGMVQLLASYFFNSPTELNGIYMRETGRTQQYWTVPYLPTPRYLQKPVYILTSSGTPSAAEAFAYDMQVNKRATIVGETTWGGANPGHTFRLSEHFGVFVPRGRAVNPVTKTNWEGTGVKPDVPSPAEKALENAYMSALKAILGHEQTKRVQEELQGFISGAPTNPLLHLYKREQSD